MNWNNFVGSVASPGSFLPSPGSKRAVIIDLTALLPHGISLLRLVYSEIHISTVFTPTDLK